MPIKQIKDGGFNLDIKNPNAPDTTNGDITLLLPEYESLLVRIASTREALKHQFRAALSEAREGAAMSMEAMVERIPALVDRTQDVASLRQLILRLAFTGGLVDERPTETLDSERWRTTTIGSIADSITPGFACSKSHQFIDGVVHLRTHNISILGTMNFDLMVRINPEMVDANKAHLKAGDVLFNNTNSQELVGKSCHVDRDYNYAFSNHITRIRLKPDVNPPFVAHYLTMLRNSGHFARICTRWINQAAVNTDALREQLISLPPLADQKRIVAKVDELMALCDQLQAQLAATEEARTKLLDALVAELAPSH